MNKEGSSWMGHIKLFKLLRTGILESLIQYFSISSGKLPDLAV